MYGWMCKSRTIERREEVQERLRPLGDEAVESELAGLERLRDAVVANRQACAVPADLVLKDMPRDLPVKL